MLTRGGHRSHRRRYREHTGAVVQRGDGGSGRGGAVSSVFDVAVAGDGGRLTRVLGFLDKVPG
jgi:hypothetical protein